MKSEQQIRDMMESNIRNFGKTDKDIFLDRAMLLSQVLEIPSDEFNKLFNELTMESWKEAHN